MGFMVGRGDAVRHGQWSFNMNEKSYSNRLDRVDCGYAILGNSSSVGYYCASIKGEMEHTIIEH